MRTVLKLAGGALAALLLAGGAGYLWAVSTAATKMNTVYETHQVDFPIPFPLDNGDFEEVLAEHLADQPSAAVAGPAGTEDRWARLDVNGIARERAIARGRYLLESRYVCMECHGADFGGGVMADDKALGRIHGPNLTTGQGSRTLDYTAADWDRIVRHSVKPDGTGSVMPCEDFLALSDRELSDIISFIRSQPPVDRTAPPVALGPLGAVLMAVGKLTISAANIHDHHAAHPKEPPPAGPTSEFGKHLAQTCNGCHRADFSGGPILGGDPSWPPAANLTRGPGGIDGWTFTDFENALVGGTSKNGTALRAPMTVVATYAGKMSAEDRAALWAYLQTLPPKADGT